MTDVEPTKSSRPAIAAENGAPLQGMRVLDLTSVIMGPYATQQLGDLGADVIMVETVDGHNSNRKMGIVDGDHPELSGIILNLLRNKRSIALDLRQPSGRDALLRIAATCDAVITNLRPKPLARLGLTYEAFAAVKPDIVFCQASGFRSDGARADDPAYDDMIQAESGLADAARRTGQNPMIAPTILADKVCGMAIAQAVLAGLLHRVRTGRGQRIEVPMADVMQAFVLVEHGAGAIRVPTTASAGYGRALSSMRGPQQTRDGWILVMPYSTAAYEAIFRAGGRDDLANDDRIRGRNLAIHATFLYEQLRVILKQRTTAEWLAFCSDNAVPVGRIVSLDELVAGLPVAEHGAAGAYRTIPCPMLFSDGFAGLRTDAPLHAEHTLQILTEAGLSDEEIERLQASKAAIVRTGDDPAPNAGSVRSPVASG